MELIISIRIIVDTCVDFVVVVSRDESRGFVAPGGVAASVVKKRVLFLL